MQKAGYRYQDNQKVNPFSPIQQKGENVASLVQGLQKMNKQRHKNKNPYRAKQEMQEKKKDQQGKNKFKYATKAQLEYLKKFQNKQNKQKKNKPRAEVQLPKIDNKNMVIRYTYSRQEIEGDSCIEEISYERENSSSRSNKQQREKKAQFSKLEKISEEGEQLEVPKQRKKVTLKQLKICIRMILFYQKLRRVTFLRLIIKQDIKSMFNELNSKIQKQISNNYITNHGLDIALQEYVSIINHANIRNNIQIKRIASNILDFSESLKTIGLRRDIIKFLKLITAVKNHLPKQYFSQFELVRLNFNSRRFQLFKINKDQIRMIVGFFLVIRVMTNCIIYRSEIFLKVFEPQKATSPIALKTIDVYGSYLYYLITKYFQFIQKNDTILEKLTSRGVIPYKMPMVDIDYYEKIQVEFNQAHKIIKLNLITWIDKITQSILNFHLEKRQSRDEKSKKIDLPSNIT